MRAFLLIFLCGLGSLHAAAPVVSNISAAQRPNSRLVDITYDVAADFPTVSVSLQVSSNGGSTFVVPATTLSGAIGAGVATGTAKKITWDAGADWSGQYSTQMRFKVIADDGNAAPTISDIAAQTITEGNNTGALAFTVGDAQTAAGSLIVSGSSSNTTLVPNANIVFGGSGASRTVTVKPVSGQSGTATITVTVSDGSLSSSDAFILTVNSAPTISDIPAQTINEGSNTGALAFTIDGAQTASDSLTLSGSSSNTSLVPNNNIVFGGSGSNRTVTVASVSGEVGMATITVTVNNGSFSISNAFALTVIGGSALIPAGSFTMGDSWDGMSDAPIREVSLDAFYIGKYEVTKAEWDSVYSWATSNGYTDLVEGSGKGSSHPVHSISWYDMVKWCNARSQKEGLTPVYYIDDAHTEIYKTGKIDLTDAQVKWTANGYRLPTEAEWEKAARGGLFRNRFPWGYQISHTRANYRAMSGISFDLSGVVNDYHPSYNSGSNPYTSPVGAFSANGYGLHDMVGNVSEWCWDRYGAYASGVQINPRGANSGAIRVARGGSWMNSTYQCRVADRGLNLPVNIGSGNYVGFRITRNSFDGNYSHPTITDILDQTIQAYGSTGALALTVGDVQTLAGSLTLSGTSSNTYLVPNSNIAFSGSGANRTVTVTPASGQAGTATITVTVSDGSLSLSDTFVLTVNANTEPTISDIAAQTITGGSNTGVIAFTIGDAQTAATSLTLSGSSSNTSLVPNTNIVFGGSGANRTVTVAPVSGQSGTATITVTVSDGTLSGRNNFVLTVKSAPPNTAPTISDIAAQTINEGGNTGVIAFTIGDAQTSASSITVSGSSSNMSLVPTANIVFGGSDENRTIMVAPVSGQSGTATITVTVSDGSMSSSDTFVFTVNANTAPTISDIAAQTINQGSNTGAIAFTIGDAQMSASSITVSGSSSNTSLVPNANIVFGGSGVNRTVKVVPASGQSGSATITVTATDGSLVSSDTFLLTVNTAVSTSFSLIPAGAFTIGDSLDGISDASTSMVTLDAFYMCKYEVTKAEWDEVHSWGLNNGYTDLRIGSGQASNHPVHSINWYQMVKWCNARSQKEGLTPVYYIDDTQTTIYKTGDVDLTNAQVKWNANGYRLPTEAEWEKAARGGLSGKRFPSGETISQSQANYRSSSSHSYDFSDSVNNFHPTYTTRSTPYTSPVGAFEATGYGLYDMAGNVSEWCWDRYGTYAVGSQTNPHGVSSLTSRVVRGGSWFHGADNCRVADRLSYYPSGWLKYYGFRVVRSSVTDDSNTGPTISDISDQTITEGINNGALIFTIGYAETAASSLTLTAKSSNAILVPNANIVFGGSGANRTLTVTPTTSQTGTATITVTVSDGTLSSSDTFLLSVYSPAPAGFALIPAGPFKIGDSLDAINSAPTRTVNLDAFYIGKYEVTKAQWDEVRTWALSNDGYTDLAVGSGKASNHPVQTITWYDMVKWCNARSQKEGLTPVYYTNDAQTAIYKAGEVNVTIAQVKWSANGYRLPTEAEWEKAARGGLYGKRFPEGDTISHSQANYQASIDYTYDSSGSINNYHPTYKIGSQPYTSPVGVFAANQYGLYDMAGNVSESCWDWYGNSTYVNGAMDPRGAASGTSRVVRGGSWYNSADYCRVAFRSAMVPENLGNGFGFRVTRSSVTNSSNTVPTISNISEQIITEGGNTGAIAFTIGDTQTAASSLTLSASSSNTNLVPNSNIIFGGSGKNRTVTVTPAGGQTGAATITVSVSDGLLSSSATFVLSVYYIAPVGLALIPAGAFIMGDLLDGISDASTRMVNLDAFYMGKFEVTKAQWDEVRAWGLSNGYTDLAAGSGKANNHPVQTISWYDMVKWCNARSQKEGLMPVYYTNDAHSLIYKKGSVNVTNSQVKWGANGYRLPTEAEWEKAARGGLSGKRFPWGDTISHDQANYKSSSMLAYDLSGTVNNFHPKYATGSTPYTSPVGGFAANGYGLYDMAGNIMEWCWDWYGAYDAGSTTNPRGAISGTYRVIRGGSSGSSSFHCRVAYRGDGYGNPFSAVDFYGFRIVRSSGP
jgi:formylglycine-generating enzyme required for sulfatase activity